MKFITVAMAFIFASAAWADVVVLKDGRRIEGDVKKTDAGYNVIAADGKVTTLKSADVLRVELSGSASSGAADKLASLRRSVEPLNDIDQIIQRYQRFISTNANTPAADDARKDLAEWESRKKQGLIKVGSDWVTPAQKAELMGKLGGMTDEAVKLAAGGQWRDASAIVSQILELDPKHISALYLQGLILHQDEKLVPARKAFEAVNSQIAGHAPTLNNLGVICIRQNQFGPALNFFDQAMAAAPNDRVIIDNVAEALNALKDTERRMPIVKKISRRFADQEAALAGEMARQGMYRWGATWVDQQKFQELQAAEAKIKERLDQLAREQTEHELNIRAIEDRIVATQRQVDDMYLHRTTLTDGAGNIISTRLPAEYYTLQRDIEVMKAQRNQEIAAIEGLHKTAERTRQDLPVPKYTGVQKMIGPEGTPVEASSPPRGAGETPSTKPD